VGDLRFGNARSISRWQAAITGGRAAVEWTEELPARARLGETWWLGLRLAEGVDPERARAQAGYDAADDPALEQVRALAAQGFLEEHRGRWRLSRAGLPLGDHIARLVLRSCDERART
jgi:coproporphyrinogen III oxidase-like Fe-S oxidoreductase